MKEASVKMLECKFEDGRYYFRTEKMFHIINAKDIVRVRCEENSGEDTYVLEIVTDLNSMIDYVKFGILKSDTVLDRIINLFETNIPFGWRTLNA